MARAAGRHLLVTPSGQPLRACSRPFSNVLPFCLRSSCMIWSPCRPSTAVFPLTTRVPTLFRLQRDKRGVRPTATRSCRGIPTGSGPQLKSREPRLSWRGLARLAASRHASTTLGGARKDAPDRMRNLLEPTRRPRRAEASQHLTRAGGENWDHKTKATR